MHFDKFSFGTLRIDGSTYEQDVVIDRGEPRKRKNTHSKDSCWIVTLAKRRCESALCGYSAERVKRRRSLSGLSPSRLGSSHGEDNRINARGPRPSCTPI
jgi:hypothetical protein